jgi:hypothetical protein
MSLVHYFVLYLIMMSYTLVSQQWVAACPMNLNEVDSSSFELHYDNLHSEKADESPAPVVNLLRPIRRFSRVAATKLEAQRIRSRVTRAEVANQAGLSLSALNDIIAARSIISPTAAARLQPLFKRDIQLYPCFPPPVPLRFRSSDEISSVTARESSERRAFARRGVVRPRESADVVCVANEVKSTPM